MKICTMAVELFHAVRQRGRQTDKAKLIVAFRSTANAPKNNMRKSNDNLNIKLHVKHWVVYQSVLSHLTIKHCEDRIACLFNDAHIGHGQRSTEHCDTSRQAIRETIKWKAI